MLDGALLGGCTGAISKKKNAHTVWRILHENSERPPLSGIHRSQQYHRRLHPGPARSIWTYLSSYIRVIVINTIIIIINVSLTISSGNIMLAVSC